MSPEQTFEDLIASKRQVLLENQAGWEVWGENWEAFLDEHIRQARSYLRSLLVIGDQESIYAFLDNVSNNFLIAIMGTIRETS